MAHRTTIVWSIGAVLAASLGLSAGNEGLRASADAQDTWAEGAEPVDRRGDDRPTAEELLRTLQRHRPVNEVVLPTGMSPNSGRSAAGTMLPEGSSIVERSGWLQKDGQWWVFVFDPAEGDSPIKLLPNATLEIMVRTASGSTAPVKFIASGELAVFEGENYLLLRVAARISNAHDQAARPDEMIREEGSPAGEAVPASGRVGVDESGGSSVLADAPVEDVVAALQMQQPRTEVMPIAPLPVEYQSGRGATATRTLKPDGTPLVHRPGRLDREGAWWTFSFESDHPDHPEPPMKLLPNLSVELMSRAAEHETYGLVFLVSGEVTLFQGENYLLSRVAMRRIDTGNLRK